MWRPSPLRGVLVRRRATLPHPVGCSTIAVPGLRFRVRNGSGRLPWAMAAANLRLSSRGSLSGVPGGLWWVGDRMVDACVLKDRSVMRGGSPRHPSKVIVSFVLPPFVGWCVCCRSTVSTGQLHPLRGFHVRPIDHVFCMESPDPRRGHGILISEQASRLDAFSGYPSRT